MNQESLDGRKKTMKIIFIPKQIQRRLKKIYNTKCCQIQIINYHHHRTAETLLHSSFPSPNDKLYHHRHNFTNVQNLLHPLQMYRQFAAKETNLCTSTLTYLCSVTTRRLSKAHDEQKTRNEGYRDAII